MQGREILRVAVGQIESHVGNVEENVRRHLEVIERAREELVDVLLFPELSLTGHMAGLDTLRVALSRDAALVRQLAQATGPMWTVFGLIEEGQAAQFYNSVMTVRDGEVVHIHRKVNLATYGKLEDGKHFAPGRYVETLVLDDRWRVAVLICNDLWNPALVWLAALHGATLLLAPVSSAIEAVGAEFDNPAGWDINLRFYAMTYGLPVAMANRVGVEGELTFWGGSCILDPFGNKAACAQDKEDLVVADLSYEDVRAARYRLPTVRDSNLALVLHETERLAREIGIPEVIRRS